MLNSSAGIIFIATVIFAFLFYKRQNGQNANVGGPISKPKSLWLAYCIGAWFVLPFVFIFDPNVDDHLKVVLCVHLISWWLRGPLELVMIYKWLNWTPVYGILHDMLHIMIVFFASSWAIANMGWATFIETQNALTFSFLAAIIFSTVAEILFASLFLATRSHLDHLIYFADETPRYNLINRFTAGVCFVVYLHFAVLAGVFLIES